MKLRCFFLTMLFAINGFSSDEKSVTERIEFLEEKQGYEFKERDFQFFAEGDLLYWKADIDGVAYATTSVTNQINGASGNLFSSIKTRTPHFSYDPGFRLGLGVQSPYDFIDLFIVWTRFYTKGHDRAHGTLVPNVPNQGDKIIFDVVGLIQEMNSIPNIASAECSMKENLIDVQFGRGIEVSTNFFMRPYFGVRGVLSDIDWKIKVKRDFIIPENTAQDSTKLKVNNDFHAVGGLIGLDLDWKAGMGFGVNIRGAGALVWGLNEERTHQKYFLVPAGTGAILKKTFKASNSFYSLKGLWELFAGVFWETDFSSKKQKEHLLPSKKKQHSASLRLHAGFEFQEWPYFGQKTNVQVTRSRERFNVGFQGFTGGAKFVF